MTRQQIQSDSGLPKLSHGLGYRPDIDGLRAVAVLAVILYHVFPGAMPGGYIGVDVFFVISGFVITNVIQADLAAGQFSLRDFYERRIRRIFPPLFTMIAVSLLIGWLILMPEDYKKLGQSSAANAVFLSNFYFLQDSGYFGDTAAAKPLLHTWSLAVEEQFYLLMPLYLLLLKRWSGSTLIRLSIGICLASLLLSIVTLSYEPSVSFFILPTRAWELLIGVLLAQGVTPVPKNAREAFSRSMLGMGLIAFAVFAYSDTTPFPGIAALAPVLGAALIISAGMSGGFVNTGLASRPMTFIGQISYPLYLWHFPLLGFANYLSLTGLSTAQTIAVNILIITCAWASWRFVERPVRAKIILAEQRQLFLFGFFCITLTLLAGLSIHFKQGIETRFEGNRLKIVQGMTDHPILKQDRCMTLSPEQIAGGNLCLMGAPSATTDTVVWGDSHGEALESSFADAAERAGKSVLFAAHSGCNIGRHLEGTDPSKMSKAVLGCAEFSEAMLNYLVASPSIRQVVLVSRWHLMRNRKGREAESLALAVRKLTEAGKHVWLVTAVPDVKTRVPRALYLKSLGLAQDYEIRSTENEYYLVQQHPLEILRNLATRPGVSLIPLHRALCNDGWCEVMQDGHPLYFDDNHLTTYGAKRVAAVFDPIFR